MQNTDIVRKKQVYKILQLKIKNQKLNLNLPEYILHAFFDVR